MHYAYITLAEVDRVAVLRHLHRATLALMEGKLTVAVDRMAKARKAYDRSHSPDA